MSLVFFLVIIAVAIVSMRWVRRAGTRTVVS